MGGAALSGELDLDRELDRLLEPEVEDPLEEEERDEDEDPDDEEELLLLSDLLRLRLEPPTMSLELRIPSRLDGEPFVAKIL